MTPRAFGEKLAESFGQNQTTNIKGYRGRIGALAGPDAMNKANDKLVSAPKPAQPATQTTPAQPPKPAPRSSSWWPWSFAQTGAAVGGALR